MKREGERGREVVSRCTFYSPLSTRSANICPAIAATYIHIHLAVLWLCLEQAELPCSPQKSANGNDDSQSEKYSP